MHQTGRGSRWSGLALSFRREMIGSSLYHYLATIAQNLSRDSSLVDNLVTSLCPRKPISFCEQLRKLHCNTYAGERFNSMYIVRNFLHSMPNRMQYT